MALPRDVVVLSDEQFNKIVELLTPGYELAKAYLAQSAPSEAPADEPVEDPVDELATDADPVATDVDDDATNDDTGTKKRRRTKRGDSEAETA